MLKTPGMPPYLQISACTCGAFVGTCICALVLYDSVWCSGSMCVSEVREMGLGCTCLI